jgi:peptidoglycan/LPS O-acetylase OafA/YrhL
MISLARFVLAISVAIFHLHKPVIAPSPSAFVAVLIFYFISGFVMQRAIQNYIGKFYKFKFVVNRLLRLLPLLLIFNILGAIKNDTLKNSILYTTNLGDFSKLTEAGQPKIFLTGILTGCVPGWSVMIELLFYIFLVSKTKRFWENLMIGINLIVIAQGIYLGGAYGFDYIYLNFFGTCAIFILGMKFSRYIDSGTTNFKVKYLDVAFFGFLGALVLMPYYYRFEINELLVVAIFSVVGILLLALAILSSAKFSIFREVDNGKSSLDKSRLFEYLGSLSFPLYICHTYWFESPIYSRIESNLSESLAAIGGKIWAELFALSVALLISHILLLIVIRPIDKIRLKVKQQSA